ncbi:MAG: DUF342 domain-containing protein, partial [Planctomycetes bacterium]|nr:DUF342 domain-containing protein [Planctomycetota bacterium]
MGRLEVTIADGGMLARVQVHRGPPSALAELRAALAAAGVVRGIDEPALQRLAQRLDDPLTELALEIAHGSSPIDGDDGRLQGDLLGGRIAGVAAADGSIDFRERHGLRAAAVGDVVAEILPATTGTAGHDVRGRALPSRPGKPHRQKAGRGVRREGDALIATVDGVVLCTDTTIDVVPLHVHAGDVDYRSGNLHTKGALVVQGDVGDGFAVTAGGDLVIAGTLQGSKARAGGRIEVERGIVGATASARSGSDIRCHHATAARLVAENTIEITDQCMQASVHAPRIHVAGERGAVRGGELRCCTSIDVTTAGSAAGIRTVLVAGDP